MLSLKPVFCCIISSFYIKPQLSSPATMAFFCCNISSFYIKPQLSTKEYYDQLSCIISSFYIKPQLPYNKNNPNVRCIISSFYIKPQHSPFGKMDLTIVLYLHSTSNHNMKDKIFGND